MGRAACPKDSLSLQQRLTLSSENLVFIAVPGLPINARAWEKGSQSISCSLAAGEPGAQGSWLNLLKAKEKVQLCT